MWQELRYYNSTFFIIIISRLKFYENFANCELNEMKLYHCWSLCIRNCTVIFHEFLFNLNQYLTIIEFIISGHHALCSLPQCLFEINEKGLVIHEILK